MLSLFLNKKKGAITIMLSFLLVAVLSVNSTFLETSRYRSLVRLYKELEENAAFSVLSQYDRELFNNFGLLAIQQDIDKEKFMKYLLANLNKNLTDINGADSLLRVSSEDINFDKIYDLSQSGIFKEQIDEFCSYRAPIYMLDEVLDIEEALKSFLKQLENMIPFLDVIKDVMDQAKGLVNLYIALDEYKESSQSLREMKNEYENSIDAYNSTVVIRNAYLDSEDDEHPIDEGTLEALNEDVAGKAGEVRNNIESLKSSLGEFYEKYTAFYDAYETFQGGHMKTALDVLDAKADGMQDAVQKESTKQMVKSMKNAYEDSEETCKKISDKMKNLQQSDIITSQENLTVQYEDLQKEGSELEETDIVSLTNGISLMDIVQLVITTGEIMAETIKKIAEALSILGEAIKILKVLGTGATYEWDYNNIINRDLCGNLKVGQDSAYHTADRSLKDLQISKTDKVAQSLGFDTSIFGSGVNVPDNNTLQNALEKATGALDSFLTGIQDLNTTGIPIISQLLAKITVAISCTVIFIEALINLASVAASVLNGEDIGKIVYQKASSAVYANSMFSNRATDIDSDKRLNGSSYGSYASPDDSACFDMANVEYIISGGINEIVNQQTVFTLMLGVRALCNIPAVFNNDLIMEVIDALGSTGILIPIAVIIFFVVLIIEAYLDMIFIIYTPEGVEFIKLEGYLDFTGEVEITEYFKQLKVVIEEIEVRQSKSNTEIDYSYTEYTSEEYGMEISADMDITFSDSFKEKYESLTKHTLSRNAIKKKNAEKLEEIKSGKAEKKAAKKIDLDKWAKEYKEGLTKANYSDHTFLLMVLLISSDKIYSRSADLINMQMRQIKKNKGAVKEFKLDEMATYLRIDSTVYYEPLLPIPIIPGLNDRGLAIRNIHYSGY